MRFLRKKIIKIGAVSLLGAGTAAGVAAGIAVSAVNTPPPLDFIVSADRAVSSLHYMKDYLYPSQWTLQNTIEGLFTVKLPRDQNPVPELLGIPTVSWLVYTDPATGLLASDETGSAERQALNDLYAPGMAESAEVFSPIPSVYSFRFKIRNDAYWANGTQVTADDFIDNMKYSLLPKTVSTINQYFSTFYKAADLTAAVAGKLDLSIEDLDKEPYAKYFSEPTVVTDANGVQSFDGGVAYSTITRDADGKITSQYLTYNLAFTPTSGQPAPALANTSSMRQRITTGPLYYPINRAFVEGIGGINEFGKSAETVLANGPFMMTELDFSFEAIYDRNPLYWDKEHVLPTRWARRVIKNTATSQSLFKIGTLANVIVQPEAYQTYSSDPYFNQYLRSNSSGSALRGWFFNLALGPNRQWTRNVHFRRAIKYGTDRGGLVKGIGYDGSPVEDIFNSPISDASDENGVAFRDVFKQPTTDGSFASRQYSVGGFAQDMIYYDQKTIDALRAAKGTDKSQTTVDPEYNPALAKAEFDLFVADMKAAGVTQTSGFEVKFLLPDSSSENTMVWMQQTLDEALGSGKIVLSGKFVTAAQRETAITETSSDYDMVLIAWGQDTNDPFSFLRLFALATDPVYREKWSGTNYNVSFTGYMTFTNPAGNSRSDQFSMMDDLERTLGNPSDKASFEKAMRDVYGVDWVTYENWNGVKDRLVKWQLAHVAQRKKSRDELVKNGEDVSNYDLSGVFNSEREITADGQDSLNLSFWLSNGFFVDGQEVPAIPISKAYAYDAILELLLRLYLPGITTWQANTSYYATRIVGAIQAPPQFFYYAHIQYKLTYLCSAPPSVGVQLPGCEAVTGQLPPVAG